MPTKKSKKSQIASLRREYVAADREYHKKGRAAFGKPSGSAAKRAYREARQERNLLGSRLGKLTGRKPRRK